MAHQALLQRACEVARRLKKLAVLYTFWPHPAKILSPQLAPPLITTAPQKLIVLKKTGIDAVVVEKFHSTFAKMTPEEFFDKVLLKNLKARALVVGYDFTFGAHRAGNAQLLAELARLHGIEVHIIPPVLLKGVIVSSSQIRRAVQAGSVDLAAQLLGRPFQLTGQVVRGTGTGQKIGVPTANLKYDNELIPGPGVYVTRSCIGKKSYLSVTNIGVRPTFGGESLTIETHIPGWKKNLYGHTLSIDFLARLRKEKRFKSIAALKSQIAKDIRRAKSL